jgi:hypothetical protein
MCIIVKKCTNTHNINFTFNRRPQNWYCIISLWLMRRDCIVNFTKEVCVVLKISEFKIFAKIEV